MLKIKQISAIIAGITVLRGIETEFKSGQLIAVVGRNGAGKTTLLRAIMGLLPLSAGSIELDGVDLSQIAAHRRTEFGVGYAPCEVLGLSLQESDRRLARVLEAVPQLEEMLPRSGAALSGGQGKMAALGRALMAGSKLVLLDEPFQGLAPVLAAQYAESLRRLHQLAPELCIIVTESNRSLLRDLPDDTLTLERGELIASSS